MAPPNVVVVLTDQLRASALGCYGDPNVSTPTIDGLAADGVQFDRAFSNHPLCTPARGAIQTGCLKFDHRATHNCQPVDTDPERPTLARTFREAGYQTGYIGKWHLDGQTGHGATLTGESGVGFVPPGPRRLGYSFWRGFNTGHDHHDGHPTFDREGDPNWPESGGWQPTAQTDIACRFVREYRDDPFFLFVSWGPPHNPYDAPDAYSARYDPDDLALRPNVPTEMRPEVRANLAEYYGMIEALDDDLDRLLDVVEECGLAEETIVVFTSDHGELMGSHGDYGKNEPYEESIRVPLVVRYPDGIDGNRRSGALVSLVDLYPTLAGLCDLPVPGRVTGRDRSSHVLGTAPPPGEAVYLESGWRAVRTERYVLRLGEDLELMELYDLESDPYQQENRLGEARPELIAELLSRLIEQAYRFNDPDVTAAAFYRGSEFDSLELDEDVAAHLDVDYEQYGRPSGRRSGEPSVR